jgi:hypothetical protein
LKAAAILFIFVACTGTVSALSIANLNFGNVNPGENSIQDLTLINSPQDIDNHFVIETAGDMKDWIRVTPREFDLAKGASQTLTVSLVVPKDAPLGSTTGTITAVGGRTVPSSGNESGGASVGYSVATKSKVSASVIKAGATADIAIVRVDVSPDSRPGDIVRFTVSAKNAGNVPVSGQFMVNISRGTAPMISVPGSTVEFGINDQQTVKLYWDTQGQEAGTYTAVISVLPSTGGKDVKIIPESYPPLTLQLGEGTTGQTQPAPSDNGISMTLIGIIIVIFAGILILIFYNRKQNG